jgi:hypothetical protein
MLGSIRSILRRLAAETRGAEIAEAAAVLPLMFMMLLGIFWFGQAFSIYGTITQAAREGARAAIAPICTTCGGSSDPSANAFQAVHNTLTAAHLDPSQLQSPPAPPQLCTCTPGGNTICTGRGAVACDGLEPSICVQGVSHSRRGVLDADYIQLSSGTGAGVCGISVSFQYPFRFWLPFTSLNKQTIWLKAQSQMRVETQ